MKLTQEYLKECLNYNPETGIFTWKERPLRHFKRITQNANHNRNIWNGHHSGNTAGTICNNYIRIELRKKSYSAHRLAFLYMEGYMPENQVDHIDRNPSNNKWCNLREVSNRCNLQNCGISKNNKSGVAGVSWSKVAKKWQSTITIDYKPKYLGIYESLDDAVKARYNEEQNNSKWSCSVNSTAYMYLKENDLI